MYASLPFGFEGGMWYLIVLITDYCLSIYFGVFTEQPYDKPLERNIVYSPIYFEPRDVNDVKTNQDSLQSDVGAVQHLAENCM